MRDLLGVDMILNDAVIEMNGTITKSSLIIPPHITEIKNTAGMGAKFNFNTVKMPKVPAALIQ